MKKVYLLVAVLTAAFQSFGQSQVVTTGNNVINTSNPYAADVVIGSDAAGGSRHDGNIMFWSSGSASRIWNSGDVFNFSQWMTNNPNVGLNATVGGNSFFQGGLGVGMPSIPSWTKFAVQGQYALGSPNGTGAGGMLVGHDGGFYFSSNSYPDNFFAVQSSGLIQIGDYVGDNNMTNFQIDDIGGSITAYSNGGFQVSNYGVGTASLGAVYGAALNYGTSYLGFNAVRSSSGSWSVKSDGYHNGGGAAYSNIFGDITLHRSPLLGILTEHYQMRM